MTAAATATAETSFKCVSFKCGGDRGGVLAMVEIGIA
jgi:hypothetical protein